MEVAKLMCGKDADLNIAQITISNCICGMQKQAVEQIKSMDIGLQLDVSIWAQRTSFASYMHENMSTKNFCVLRC
jgi:hypothetical protein